MRHLMAHDLSSLCISTTRYFLLCAAALLLATPPAKGQFDSVVDGFTKELTKFSEVKSSYQPVRTIPYEGSESLGLPKLPHGRELMDDEVLEGTAFHLLLSGAARNVSQLHGEPGSFGGNYINGIIGADRFYAGSVFGSNAVVANIEGGRAWDEHESLRHVTEIPSSIRPSQVDRHATWTSGIIAGRPGGNVPGQHQIGVAPGAELHSGGFANNWGGNRYSFAFSFFTNVVFDRYNQAIIQGLSGPGGTRTADVVNSSYAVVGQPVAGTVELMLDAMAATSGTTLLTQAAGNNGFGVNTVATPATSYNGISVASLTALTNYETASVTSSGGDIDYVDPVNGTSPGARRGVDIAAPGENLGAAYYGGLTGGNGPNLAGLPSGPLGGSDFYARELDGTSYAAPIVAGGAALIYDAAKQKLPTTPAARDNRVVKAVLMNSAQKTSGWDNGQEPHPNGNGGVMTTVSLDPRVGTGRMNLNSAFDQFLGGVTDVSGVNLGSQGLVDPIGWDLGRVAEGTPTDYYLNAPMQAGSTFTATLTWFRDRRMFDSGDDGVTFVDDNFSDLDLEVWSVTGGVPDALISESSSTFNNSEHLSFTLPETGRYMVRVKWFQEIFDSGLGEDPNQVVYGLAWTGAAGAFAPIPEPSTLVLVSICLLGMVAIRRRSN